MSRKKRNSEGNTTKQIWPTLEECKWVGDTLCKRNRRLFEIATTSEIRAEVIQAIITTWIGSRGGKL